MNDLFYDERVDKPKIENPIDGPHILKYEMKERRIGRERAAGPDNVSIELLNDVGDLRIEEFADF